ETSKSFDVAAEFVVLNDRVRGSVEYFHRVSSDLLFSVPQPISSGIDNVDVNAGSMYNKGVEVVLDGDVYRNKYLRIGVNLNTTFLQNKITKLPLDTYPTSVYKIELCHYSYDFMLMD